MIRQSPLGTRTIEKNRVVLVEGQDDERFFRKFLSHLGVGEEYQLWDYEGKEHLSDSLMRISKDEGARSGALQTLIVTIDADNDAQAAFSSVVYHLNANGLQPPKEKNKYSGSMPIDVGVFLLCGRDGRGMLENLCLETVADHAAMPCVHSFSECVMALDNKPRNKAKAEAQSFMAAHAFPAAMPKFVRHVGEAAEKGYWNFDSETLTELREFLLRVQSN